MAKQRELTTISFDAEDIKIKDFLMKKGIGIIATWRIGAKELVRAINKRKER